MRKKGKIIIELRSDACIHSGYSYRGLIDNDVCCDKFGIPFIPARRLKGCLRDAAGMLKKHPDLKNVSADCLFGERGEFRAEKVQTKGGVDKPNVVEIGNIVIENAHVPNYEQIWDVLESFKELPLEKYIGRQDILSQYTSIRAQTRMVSTSDKAFADEQDIDIRVPSDIGIGCAMDNTLRFTRVINAHLPKPICAVSDGTSSSCSGQENTEAEYRKFEADIYYSDIDSDDGTEPDTQMTEVEKAICSIVKAVRHIGLSRNRGLGSVTCDFVPGKKKCENKDDFIRNDQQEMLSSQPAEEEDNCDRRQEIDMKKPAIFFSVKNTEPLIISEGIDNSTESYIPARNVCGALAWEYLSQQGNSAESEEFRQLFLDGTIRYTNLYIMDGETRCIPAPGFVSELKKSKLLVNALRMDEYDRNKREENPGDGNLPKKLKGKYICISTDGTIHKKEVETEIICHNRHVGSTEEQGIYSQEVISEGQVFGGYIYCAPDAFKASPELTGNLLSKIRTLLESAYLRFGKSRSAQYGRCVLMPGMPKYSDLHMSSTDSVEPARKNASLQKNGHILVSLASDGIFCEKACYTTEFNSVYKTIASDAGIINYVEIDDVKTIPDYSQGARLTSICETGVAYGFNSKWNLRKQPIPTVRAGSTFVYKLKDELEELPDISHFVQTGEHRTEGFGELCLLRMSEKELPYRLERIADNDKQTSDAQAAQNDSDWVSTLGHMLKSQEADGAADAMELIKRCVLNHAIEEMSRKAMNDLREKSVIDLSSSTIGRVSLMLNEVRHQECCDESGRQSALSPKDQFYEFAGRGNKNNPARIRSIKRKKERQEIEKLIKTYFVSSVDTNPDADWGLDCQHMVGKLLPQSHNKELRKIMDELFSTEEQVSIFEGLWPEMMEVFLRGSKYIKKVSGVSGE